MVLFIFYCVIFVSIYILILILVYFIIEDQMNDEVEVLSIEEVLCVQIWHGIYPSVLAKVWGRRR